jgi:hypothetical protein
MPQNSNIEQQNTLTLALDKPTNIYNTTNTRPDQAANTFKINKSIHTICPLRSLLCSLYSHTSTLSSPHASHSARH